jgi:hypothetical protein
VTLLLEAARLVPDVRRPKPWRVPQGVFLPHHHEDHGDVVRLASGLVIRKWHHAPDMIDPKEVELERRIQEEYMAGRLAWHAFEVAQCNIYYRPSQSYAWVEADFRPDRKLGWTWNELAVVTQPWRSLPRSDWDEAAERERISRPALSAIDRRWGTVTRNIQWSTKRNLWTKEKRNGDEETLEIRSDGKNERQRGLSGDLSVIHQDVSTYNDDDSAPRKAGTVKREWDFGDYPTAKTAKHTLKGRIADDNTFHRLEPIEHLILHALGGDKAAEQAVRAELAKPEYSDADRLRWAQAVANKAGNRGTAKGINKQLNALKKKVA